MLTYEKNGSLKIAFESNKTLSTSQLKNVNNLILTKKKKIHQIQHSNQLNPLEANLEYLLKKGVLITDPTIQFTPGMNLTSFFPCEQQMKASSLSVS